MKKTQGKSILVRVSATFDGSSYQGTTVSFGWCITILNCDTVPQATLTVVFLEVLPS